MKYHLVLRDILISAHSEITKIPEEILSEKLASNKWSKKEILGHLIDSASNNYQRFIRAKDQEDLVFDGYDQDAWVKRNRYQERDMAEILDTWWAINRHIAELIEGLSEEVLKKESKNHNFDMICMRPLSKEHMASLSYLIWDYLFHLEYHLAQIIPDYEKQMKLLKVEPS